ncbi:hypothetical protein ACIBL6_47500 [Streptomyces sp. NPDC050400]|uniref:hypothetical protein n=1 Tax=Streptomyces sp. NPDC050400 TaxID=3365610 RepID=UPI0037A4C616
MPTLCDHRRPDYHPTGETCRRAADLKPGDSVAIIGGRHRPVHEVRPAGAGLTFLWLKGTDDGDIDVIERIPSNTPLPVRPAEGLSPEEQHPAPTQKLLDMPDCAHSWADGVTPCYRRPDFIVTGFDKVPRLACTGHVGDVLAEVTGPDQSATVTAYEGN